MLRQTEASGKGSRQSIEGGLPQASLLWSMGRCQAKLYLSTSMWLGELWAQTLLLPRSWPQRLFFSPLILSHSNIPISFQGQIQTDSWTISVLDPTTGEAYLSRLRRTVPLVLVPHLRGRHQRSLHPQNLPSGEKLDVTTGNCVVSCGLNQQAFNNLCYNKPPNCLRINQHLFCMDYESGYIHQRGKCVSAGGQVSLKNLPWSSIDSFFYVWTY